MLTTRVRVIRNAAIASATLATSLFLLPATAGATPYGPARASIVHLVRSFLEKRLPANELAGSDINCTYRASAIHIGYKFTCYVFNKSSTQIAYVNVVTLTPKGNYWYFDMQAYR
jgi:hypothetical protein